jgi:hypothetical protein
MPYRIRYHRDAKADLQKCRETYPSRVLPDRLDKWLRSLADEAESKDWVWSKDLTELLGKMDEAEELVRQWPNLWQRFWTASFKAKLKAAYLVMTGRLPYQARASVRVFTVFATECEVTALYLVDHAAREVIFMAFDGLPMQGYE